MKKLITLISLIIIPTVISTQVDEQKEYSIFKTLIDKKWTGKGVLMGQEATFNMNWQKVLDNKFIKLEFKSTIKSPNNEGIVFRATAFYKIVNDTIVTGNWFDNRGLTFPLKGTLTGDKLVILWGDEKTELGKTIYYYSKDENKITVEDFIINNGKISKFGNANYIEKQ